MTDQATRQKILDAALKAFSIHGYQKSSIKKIAEAAEINSSALIYHYFEDKKAVFSAVMREMAPVHDGLMLHPEFAKLLSHLTQFVGIFRVQHVASLQIFVRRRVRSATNEISTTSCFETVRE